MGSDMSGVATARPGAILLQKPFSEAQLARSMQRALDAPA
jgi:hypothetical protein